MNPTPTRSDPSAAGLSDAEVHLGHALVHLHRALAGLQAPDAIESVDRSLESAEQAVAEARSALRAGAAGDSEISGEILALIAAAVAITVGRPHRVLHVQPSVTSPNWVSPWAIEGRFLHYSSHRVR